MSDKGSPNGFEGGSSDTEGSLSHDSYTIGWICALPIELAASHAMFDTIHNELPNQLNDRNRYFFGMIGSHNVVMTCLSEYGNIAATTAVGEMRASFPSIRFYLLVGVGGGVPGTPADIRLGDIVVGTTVVQYDFGKIKHDGNFEMTSTPTKPPRELLSAVSGLQGMRLRDPRRASAYLAEIVTKLSATTNIFNRPEQDKLFNAAYEHIGQDTCSRCDETEIIVRPGRETKDAVVHYGLVASGNRVIKHGPTRDSIARQLNASCFEMEAAGLVGVFDCLTIRGICDYCDSHKNKIWQGHAALVAACYTKDLLTSIQLHETSDRRRTYRNRGSKQDKIACLQSLAFPDLDARLESIELAHRGTCDWLFETEQFQRWKARDGIKDFNGVLWIKGKPGAGKSTLMKHIRRHYQKSSHHIIIRCFFSARGSELEKSYIGLLRSLLFHLLDQNTEALDDFLSLFLDKRKRNRGIWEWRTGELEDFLLEWMSTQANQPILVLVDALDECCESEVEKAVYFLERLSCQACNEESKGLISICLSSRHYPTITMRKVIELVVDNKDGHSRDIILYVEDRLRLNSGEIKTELLRKASGVFMWIVLVVRMLNQAWDEGEIDNGSIWKKVQDIPDQLDEVFHMMLTKDNQNKPKTLLMLQLVLFARERLRPESFYCAVLAGLGVQKPVTLKALTIIERFIINGSKGLIEVRKRSQFWDEETDVVQFIHESVNDFLLRNKRLQLLDPNLALDTIGVSHQKIASCCLAYLETEALMDIISKTTNNASRHYICLNYPFLEYGVINLFYHAERACGGSVEKQGFLECVQRDPMLFELVKSVYRVSKFSKSFTHSGEDVEWYGPDSSLLYFLSFLQCPKLAQALLLHPGVDVNARMTLSYYPTALHAAIASTTYQENTTGEIIHVLLDAGADINFTDALTGSILQTAVCYAFRHSPHTDPNISRAAFIANMLIERGADVNLPGGWYGNALYASMTIAAEADSLKHEICEVIDLLLDAGAFVNVINGRYGSALQSAIVAFYHCKGGFNWDHAYKVILKLLDAGANVNLQGGYYGNALQAAAAMNACKFDVDQTNAVLNLVEFLLLKGANVNAQGGFHGTALQAAVTCDNQAVGIKIAKALLDAGADVNAPGGQYQNAVRAIVETGRKRYKHLQNPIFQGASLDMLELLKNAGAVGAAEAKLELFGIYDWSPSTILWYETSRRNHIGLMSS